MTYVSTRAKGAAFMVANSENEQGRPRLEVKFENEQERTQRLAEVKATISGLVGEMRQLESLHESTKENLQVIWTEYDERIDGLQERIRLLERLHDLIGGDNEPKSEKR